MSKAPAHPPAAHHAFIQGTPLGTPVGGRSTQHKTTQASKAAHAKAKASARKAAQTRKRNAAAKKKQAQKAGKQRAGTSQKRALAGANVLMPVCGATAIANHLALMTGTIAPEQEILALHLAAGGGQDGARLGDLLDTLDCRGLAGRRLAGYGLVAGCDTRLKAGLVAGLRSPQGAHAVLLLSDVSCVSWGSILPVMGEPEELWWAEWEPLPYRTSPRPASPGPTQPNLTSPDLHARITYG